MAPEGDWPDGIAARPIERADVEAWVRLLNDIEAVERADLHHDAEGLAEVLANPRLDPARDTLGLWHGDRLVGYGHVRPPVVAEAATFRAAGGVHPDWRRRGLGLGLVAWMRARSTAIRAERHPDKLANLDIGGPTENAALQALAEQAGFEAVRWFRAMAFDLTDDPIPPARTPVGGRITVFEPALDEATLEAHNEAFLDHWGFVPRDQEFWHRHATRSQTFRAGLSSLLLDERERVVAYVLGYENEARERATGQRDCYLGQIGTRREWRGRGAAQALIANSLANAKAAGYDIASLAVDADNLTGALGLYERIGFRTTRCRTDYRCEL
ncbi:GNAT family N-acetyltransferase [Flindersiella endophytica]